MAEKKKSNLLFLNLVLRKELNIEILLLILRSILLYSLKMRNIILVVMDVIGNLKIDQVKYHMLHGHITILRRQKHCQIFSLPQRKTTQSEMSN